MVSVDGLEISVVKVNHGVKQKLIQKNMNKYYWMKNQENSGLNGQIQKSFFVRFRFVRSMIVMNIVIFKDNICTMLFL